MRTPRVVTEVSRAGRRIRRPVHTFNLVQQPYAITPFMIAPVIPGETLRNAVLQCRTVSHPIANDLVGWWLEHYFFYVKVRDMDIRDDVTEMFIDPEFSLPSALQESTASQVYYHGGKNRINWTKHALERVVSEYFRNEGEGVNDFTIGGLPMASVNLDNWAHSIIAEGDFSLLDVDVDPGSDNVLQASEVEAAMRQYEILKMNGLVEMTYEDFLRSYGIRGAAVEQVEPHRPELLRYEKSWTAPSNTVEVDGIRSVVAWNQAFRLDKDRFFSEPGFILGLTVARPKVYMSNQDTSAVALIDEMRPWLPAVMSDQQFTSMIPVPDGTGPMTTDPSGYWVDIKDLLLYGDQFINHSGTVPSVAIPSATDFNKRYAASAEIAALFADSGATGLRTDGIVSMMIASRFASRDETIQTGASVSV